MIEQHISGSERIASNKSFVLQTLVQFPEVGLRLLLILSVDTTKLLENYDNFAEGKTSQMIDLECDPLPDKSLFQWRLAHDVCFAVEMREDGKHSLNLGLAGRQTGLSTGPASHLPLLLEAVEINESGESEGGVHLSLEHTTRTASSG